MIPLGLKETKEVDFTVYIQVTMASIYSYFTSLIYLVYQISFSSREKHWSLSETGNIVFKMLEQGSGGTLLFWFYKQGFSFDASFKLKTTYISQPPLFIVKNII